MQHERHPTERPLPRLLHLRGGVCRRSGGLGYVRHRERLRRDGLRLRPGLRRGPELRGPELPLRRAADDLLLPDDPQAHPCARGAGGCCCKQSFRAALQLLCDSQIASLVDFDAAVFLTDTYSAGATLSTTVPETTPTDNLGTPSGSFLRLSSCNCDLLEISATLYMPPATSTGATATQVSLCELAAIALQVAPGHPPRGTSPPRRQPPGTTAASSSCSASGSPPATAGAGVLLQV